MRMAERKEAPRVGGTGRGKVLAGRSGAGVASSPEGEVIAAYGAAMVAAFQVLINCLEENGVVEPRQFPDALGVYMEMVKSSKGAVSDVTLAVLHDIRMATVT
jgi:hypothetical protein